jgi:ribosomal protein S27AE
MNTMTPLAKDWRLPLIYKNCPRCKIGELDTRVRRNILIKHMLFFVEFKRYKCSNCGNRIHLKHNVKVERKAKGKPD